ncbi:MAG: GNAT family N-acetyltransferase [Gemmatimonadota bacterium]
MSAPGRPLLRPATEADAPLILALIRELADYERLLGEVDATEDGLRAALFGPAPRVCCALAEWQDTSADGHADDGLADDGLTAAGTQGPRIAAGFALWFYNFSTFRGRHGIYLEDLFVRPAFRGRGIGRALLAGLAARCVREGLARLEWSVLDWNEPALVFYRSLGARAMEDWVPHRVTGEALTALAAEARG